MTSDLAISKVQSEFSRLFPTTSKSRQTLIKLAGDISTRRYYRLQTGDQSFIVQQADAFTSENENPFILAQKIFAHCGVRVPKILESRPSEGLILMEDLGDRMLQEDASPANYHRVLKYWTQWTHEGHDFRMPLALQKAPHFRQFFDTEKLGFEMKHTDTHLFEKLLRRPSGEFFQMTQENTAFLDARPRFLCHRDYHSRNIMQWENESYVIDFQDARMGPISYDLVSLLWDPYVQLAPTLQNDLLGEWKKKVFCQTSDERVNGLLRSAETYFDEEVHRMKIQRLLKAAGSYASFFNTRGRKDYLHCIAYAVAQSLESLDWLQKNRQASSDDVSLAKYLRSHNFDRVGV